MKGYELRLGVETMAHKVCAALNLPPVKIRWVGIPTAAINQKGEMLLSNVADNAQVNKQLINKYAGFVVHELLHRKYTDFTRNDHRPYVAKLHNAIEDAWIERTAIKSKLTGNIANLLRTLANGLIEEANAGTPDWSDPRNYPFALALWARGFCNRVPVPANLHPVFDEALRRVDTCLNSANTLELARWVFDQIQQQAQNPAQPEQPEQPEQQPGKDAAEPQTPSADADSQPGEPGMQGEGAPSNDEVNSAKGDKPSTKGTSKKPDVNDAAEVEPSLPCDVENQQGHFSSDDLMKPGHHCRDSKVHTVPDFNAGKLRFEVRKLFENSAFDDFSINRKSGSLNVAALHRVNVCDKLFKRHQEHDGIDSAVIILIDCSGSMSKNNRIDTAIDTAAALYETLHKAGVSTAIMSFSDAVAMPVNFGTPITRTKQMISKLIEGGGTADYRAIRLAHNLLLNRREQRKVVFALTDGDGSPSDARKQIKIGESLGITTIGIGIQQIVSRVYQNSVTINDLSQLAAASFKRIKLAA